MTLDRGISPRGTLGSALAIVVDAILAVVVYLVVKRST